LGSFWVKVHKEGQKVGDILPLDAFSRFHRKGEVKLIPTLSETKSVERIPDGVALHTQRSEVMKSVLDTFTRIETIERGVLPHHLPVGQLLILLAQGVHGTKSDYFASF